MDIELAHLKLPGLTQFGDPWNGGEQREQIFRANDDELGAALGGEWQVTGELQCIACALLCVDQQGLAGQGLTIPKRMGTSKGRELAGLPAPFVLIKAARVILKLQQCQT
ncbi:MAG: hypothetical protein ACREYE_03415 [Gammaproteobacteria bacterium]